LAAAATAILQAGSRYFITTLTHVPHFSLGSRSSACDLSGLRVLAKGVHFEGNLGDEMETTPLFHFLRRCDARVTAQLSAWRGGEVHPNSARNVALVDDILLPTDNVNASDFDVVISAPGPGAKLSADVIFGATIPTKVLRRKQIQPTTKLIVAREPLTYEAVLGSISRGKATHATKVFMGADLSFSFPASVAALNYWDRYFRELGFAGSTLVFSRANNFGEGKGVSISGKLKKSHVRLQVRWSSNHSYFKTISLDRVVFASSSIIEDGYHFQDLNKKYSTSANGSRNSRFIVCTQVEQLWALVRISRIVYTDRYHPGVAARIHNVPLKLLVYPREQQKLDGLMELSNMTATELKSLNQEAFQMLRDALHEYKTN